MRTRSSRGRIAVGPCSLASIATMLLAGCTTQMERTQIERSDLDSWLAGTAAPAVAHWRSQVTGPVSVTIVPTGGNAAPVSELTYGAAATLAASLRSAGIAADLPDHANGDSTSEHACVRGEPATLLVSLAIRPAGTATPDGAEVTVRSLTESPVAANSLVSTHLILSRRELGNVRIPRTLPAAPGTQARPYSPSQMDELLADVTQSMRCDLLRARWRIGDAQVSWDSARPAPWYRSLGLRIRDGLARLDVVNGAPGSPNAVARLELRAEPTADANVLRIIVRAAANESAGHAESVLWHQTYFQAPGPASAPDPAINLAATALPAPEARPTPLPSTSDRSGYAGAAARTPEKASTLHAQGTAAQVDPSRATAARIGAFRAVRLGSGPDCSREPMLDDSVHTGDCIAFELSSVSGEALYLLHQDAHGSLSRVAPSTCASTPPSRVWLARFRVPGGSPNAPLIRLTPPAGRERFLAVATDGTTDLATLSALEALPDACGEDATGLAANASRHLVDALSLEAGQGRAALRTVVVIHEDPTDGSASRIVRR